MAENVKTQAPAADRPSMEELEAELAKLKYRRRYRHTLRNTIFTLVTVAAVAILVATLWLPVLRTYGASMEPTLEEGNIVVSLKTSEFNKGDIVAFYYNNKILIKRCIASSGDWVDLDEEGNVYVNGVLLDEPYLQDRAFGDCNIDLPYQVPESRIFVMGDNRSVSLDSRNTSIGCVAEEQIVGKMVFRVWPLKGFGKL